MMVTPQEAVTVMTQALDEEHFDRDDIWYRANNRCNLLHTSAC